MNSKAFLVLFFVVIFCFSSLANANDNLSSPLEKAIEYSINTKILALLTLSKEKPDKVDNMLTEKLLEITPLNPSEQYLVLLSKANIAQFNKQHQQVITLLEQAILLQDDIAKKQLASPLFANLYQVLATSLAATKNYEQAYKVKKSYVDDYNDYSDAQRDSIVKNLTEKHEITYKIESNNLLDNQTKLKAIRLDDVEKQQVIQQRNFIFILCTLVVFFLFFLRQLKVRKKLILLTKIDSLTGLINRTTLFVKGDKLVETSKNQQLELSVMLFDIDHFKLINNNYGHHIGDLVLAKIAELVSETMRSRDIFARISGEEFVAILPSTDIDKAKAIAVRVVEKIASYDFSPFGINNNITLSVGVANNNDTNAVFDDLLYAAELAKYQARAQGRNQMASYDAIANAQERRKR